MKTLRDEIWSVWGPPLPLVFDDRRGKLATNDGGGDRNHAALKAQRERALADRVAVEGNPVDADGGDADQLESLLTADAPPLCEQCGEAYPPTQLGGGTQQCPKCGHTTPSAAAGDGKIADAFQADLPSKTEGVATAARTIANSKQARAAAAMDDAYACGTCGSHFKLKEQSRCERCGAPTNVWALRERPVL